MACRRACSLPRARSNACKGGQRSTLAPPPAARGAGAPCFRLALARSPCCWVAAALVWRLRGGAQECCDAAQAGAAGAAAAAAQAPRHCGSTATRASRPHASTPMPLDLHPKQPANAHRAACQAPRSQAASPAARQQQQRSSHVWRRLGAVSALHQAAAAQGEALLGRGTAAQAPRTPRREQYFEAAVAQAQREYSADKTNATVRRGEAGGPRSPRSGRAIRRCAKRRLALVLLLRSPARRPAAAPARLHPPAARLAAGARGTSSMPGHTARPRDQRHGAAGAPRMHPRLGSGANPEHCAPA